MPPALFDRPKTGFSVPMAAWLRGPLKEWAAELLSPQALQETGLFNARQTQKLWQEFQAGRYDHHHILWTLLMAQAWHRRWMR